MPSKRKPKVVLDSVVLVSAFLTEGLASELLDMCRKEATLYTAEEILQEIRRVLLEKEYIRNRYQYSDADVEIFVPDLRVIERDPKDDSCPGRLYYKSRSGSFGFENT
jgi:predicted nucleic acid-binding protein